jgi:hypothetical protein
MTFSSGMLETGQLIWVSFYSLPNMQMHGAASNRQISQKYLKLNVIEPLVLTCWARYSHFSCGLGATEGNFQHFFALKMSFAIAKERHR